MVKIDLERLRKLLTPGESLKDVSVEADLKRTKKSRDSVREGKTKAKKTEPQIFVAVANKGNYLICKEKRIYATKRASQLNKVKKEDILVFYITKLSQFPGIYKVTEEVYKTNQSYFENVFYKYNIGITPIIELPEEKWIKLKDIKDNIEIVRDKTIPAGKFFQTILRSLDKKDYQFILNMMTEILRKDSQK